MSIPVQITFIICGTIVVLYIISMFDRREKK